MSKPSTYHLDVRVVLAGLPRTLRLTQRAILRACGLLKRSGFGGSVRAAVADDDIDVLVVAIVAAAALAHESPDISPNDVCDLIDAEPSRYAALRAAVIEATTLAYEAMGVLAPRKKDGASGEARTTSTSGAPSFDTPLASASPGAPSGT